MQIRLAPDDQQSSPTQLLDGADINNTIVKMLDKFGHVTAKEHLVDMNAVACKWTSQRWRISSHKLKQFSLCIAD